MNYFIQRKHSKKQTVRQLMTNRKSINHIKRSVFTNMSESFRFIISKTVGEYPDYHHKLWLYQTNQD